MGHSTGNEREDRALSSDSPLSNDGDNFFRGSDRGVILKKGPWTNAEDAILIDYVKKHGEGNWNSVQKHTGLSRCGKSCRLRWANHLRPNLKKGAFTPEEERLIMELHAKMGNKWARMAVHLPGRTDNEIKNYWNTRIKRRQRAGLPLYPTEFFQQALQEHQQNHNSSGTFGGDEGCHDSLPSHGYETPDVTFDSLNMLTYRPEFPDISAGGSLISGFGSPQFSSFLPQTVGLHKLTQELDHQMDFGSSAVNDAYPFDMARNDRCENKMSQSYDLCFPSDPNHTKQLWPFGVSPDSHFMSNDIFSASEPLEGAEKLELPSLQYQETNSGVRGGLLPLVAAPESWNSFIQSPISGTHPSHCPSPRSSGLLEALLYEAKFISKSENQFSNKATSSTISQGAITCCSSLKAHSTEIKGIDPTSPSVNSTGSIFNWCSPADPIGTAMEENMRASQVKLEAVNRSPILDGDTKETLSHLDCLKPDAVVGASWLEQSGYSVKQRGSITDDIFLGDDLGSELKHMSSGTSGWGHSSCTWNNMPSAYQMSDLQ